MAIGSSGDATATYHLPVGRWGGAAHYWLSARLGHDHLLIQFGLDLDLDLDVATPKPAPMHVAAQPQGGTHHDNLAPWYFSLAWSKALL